MSENILTIALDGDITLLDFSTAMGRFRLFVYALSHEVAGRGKVAWRIEDLQAASAIATVRGESTDPEAPPRVVRAFASVGEALQERRAIEFSERVQRHAYNLRRLVRRSIHSIRLETPFSDALLTNGQGVGPRRLDDTSQPKPATITHAYGQFRGTVQTLTSRRGLRFTLYDAIFDKPVSCYLSDGQEEIMRGAWGRKVTVSGLIGREPYQKRPVVIRQIKEVKILKDVTPGTYRQARGILKREEGREKAEVLIRRLRDAW